MKIRLFTFLSLFAISCSSGRFGYQSGDLVKIKNGKDVFRINEPEYRKPKAYKNWNGLFYDVTHTRNGKHFSLPEKSLVLVQRKKPVPTESPRVIANDPQK